MSWEEVKAQLDLLAALRGYKPVDEVLKNSVATPLKPRKSPETLHNMSAQRQAGPGWWNREQ